MFVHKFGTCLDPLPSCADFYSISRQKSYIESTCETTADRIVYVLFILLPSVMHIERRLTLRHVIKMNILFCFVSTQPSRQSRAMTVHIMAQIVLGFAYNQVMALNCKDWQVYDFRVCKSTCTS